MRELTFVEAAREGLAEEMERDPLVLVVGEGIGPRGGNFNTTLGLYERFGPERLRDARRSASAASRPLHRRSGHGHAADCRLHVHRLHRRCLRRSVQPDRQAPVDEQRPAQNADRAPRLHGRLWRANGAHHSGNYYPFFMHVPGISRCRPHDARRCQGPAEDRHPLRRPRALPGAQGPAEPQRAGARWRAPGALRPCRDCRARGEGRHDRRASR